MATRAFSFSLVRSKSTTSLASNSSSRSTLTSHSNNSVLGLSSSSQPHVLHNSTSSPSLSAQISPRPRLNKHKKRVSFDVASASVLNSENLLSFDAPPYTPSTASRWKARRSEIDGSVDLRAVLAAGILEWRDQVDDEIEGVQNA